MSAQKQDEIVQGNVTATKGQDSYDPKNWVITFERGGASYRTVVPNYSAETDLAKILDKLNDLITAANDDEFNAFVNQLKDSYGHLSPFRVLVYDTARLITTGSLQPPGARGRISKF